MLGHDTRGWAIGHRHLGVDTKAKYIDRSGRPHIVLPEGEAIDELM